MASIYYSELDSPVGTLLLRGNGQALTHLHMHNQKHRSDLPENCERNDRAFRDIREQLNAYFAGKLQRFDVPLAGEGTAFQKTVWRALLDIPFGTTQTYGELAKRLGNANASRAVGLANGRNPIGIIVPCHRVIGANGSLTGYAGGLERKQWLLAHEQKFARHAQIGLELRA
jgi:methylated-DNA-[protein]-cysteine S-methyltransferase